MRCSRARKNRKEEKQCGWHGLHEPRKYWGKTGPYEKEEDDGTEFEDESEVIGGI